MAVRFSDGWRVEVVTDEPALRKSLRHQQGRKAYAAADISNLGSRFQFRRDALKSRQPVLHDVVHITWSEKRAGCAEQATGRVSPAHAGTGTERVLYLRLSFNHGGYVV